MKKQLPEGILDEFRPVRRRPLTGWIILSLIPNVMSVFNIFYLHGWLTKSLCLLCSIMLSLTTYFRWKADRLLRRKWGS